MTTDKVIEVSPTSEEMRLAERLTKLTIEHRPEGTKIDSVEVVENFYLPILERLVTKGREFIRKDK